MSPALPAVVALLTWVLLGIAALGTARPPRCVDEPGAGHSARRT